MFLASNSFVFAIGQRAGSTLGKNLIQTQNLGSSPALYSLLIAVAWFF